MKILPIKKKDNSVCEGYEETRFAIADNNEKIVDDAQGWGYKTAQKAQKAMWYKFNGGKQKKETEENDRKQFFKEHKGIERFIYDICMNNIKEMARGEVTDEDVLNDIKKKFGIDMPKKYLYN